MRSSHYVVETRNTENDSYYNYHENAASAQAAVNYVRMYIDDRTEIVAVYKLVDSWK